MARKNSRSHRAKCQLYKTRGMRERNKKRKLEKHLKNNKNDEIALKALKNL